MAASITKAQLARLAFARLRQIAPNETFQAEDEDTIVLEIDLAKTRLEASIFGGVTLWTHDNRIPVAIVEGFLLSVIPFIAQHYQASAPQEMIGDGYKELCRQLAKHYNPDTIGDDEEPESELIVLLDGVVAAGNSEVFSELIKPLNFQLWIAGTSGEIAATVKLWGSNDDTALEAQANAAKTLLLEVELSGTGLGEGIAVDTEQFLCNTQFAYYWAEVSSISGTDAAITANVR